MKVLSWSLHYPEMQARELELDLEDTCEVLSKGKLLDLSLKSIQKAIV